MRNIVAIIQARMDSSRLPGKVMQEIAGRPMLAWVVERTRQAKLVDQVVVATTLSAADDPVFEFCKQADIRCGRGSEQDVLDRYYQVARHFKATVVIRITADCPLLDPVLIDQAVQLLLSQTGSLPLRSRLGAARFDFVTNRLPPPWGRTYPIGLDVEVFTWDALQQAWKRSVSQYQREHVTPYMYEGTPTEQLKYAVKGSAYSSAMTPEGLHIALLHHEPDYGHLRWTVDTPEDLELVRQVVQRLPDQTEFGWYDIVKILEQEPALKAINLQVRHKTQFDVDERAV
ncbi:MAG: glycosyltransferase family protein [Anaerolineales bacterium]|nr:glycosyltransferase family protein [Anaerolineales bacterium]